jgi:hypothetical protein
MFRRPHGYDARHALHDFACRGGVAARENRLPLAALMIGSLSPDFAYFLPAELSRASTHNLNGICFSAAGQPGLWLLFVRVLERPTIELLPAAWRWRVPRSDPLSWRSLGFAGIAVIVGAVTHVLWDAFTHAHTFVTNTFPECTPRPSGSTARRCACSSSCRC